MKISIGVNDHRALKLEMPFLAAVQTMMEQQLLIFLKYSQVSNPLELLLVLGKLLERGQERLSGELVHGGEVLGHSLDFALLGEYELVDAEGVEGLGSVLVDLRGDSLEVVVFGSDHYFSSFHKVYRLIGAGPLLKHVLIRGEHHLLHMQTQLIQ
jgi:hypothetical protein